jgi:hypothetical protein
MQVSFHLFLAESLKIALGGFLEPRGYFEGRRTAISVTRGFESDKRNPPLHTDTHLPANTIAIV